jgi:hypothetical protein
VCARYWPGGRADHVDLCRHFFWAQDVDSSKDEERVAKVNQLLSGEEEDEEVTGGGEDASMEMES